MKMKEVFLGMGTNMGNREKNLRDALDLVTRHVGSVSEFSGVYETEPWGFETDDKFLNMVVSLRTGITPQTLLQKTGLIENIMGRIRKENQYTSRIIDIDILFYGDEVTDEPGLKIPHPRIEERRFVLVPLNEIAPYFLHPVLRKTVSSILESCTDKCSVVPLGRLSGLIS
jgi:2-amino-4-hydroxy-6-hydroxymethyldihydropteridine diphosphokinase